MQKDSSTWIVHHVKEAVVNNVRLTARVDEAVSMTIDFDFADNTYYEIPAPASCSTTGTASGSDIYCNLKY
ncbi:MAG TPA: hypothetical protein EYP33_01180, partial [Pyrodictium sp.]|nr:hypothetical protein [Pyrodictium sp.]